jgi:hypothetical protein
MISKIRPSGILLNDPHRAAPKGILRLLLSAISAEALGTSLANPWLPNGLPYMRKSTNAVTTIPPYVPKTDFSL